MEIQRLLDFKEKLKEQRDYESNNIMIDRITKAIAFIDESVIELWEKIWYVEYKCKKILSSKQ